jgi:hypothetical protein
MNLMAGSAGGWGGWRGRAQARLTQRSPRLIRRGLSFAGGWEKRLQTPDWLPELVPQSVEFGLGYDESPLSLHSLERRVADHVRERRVAGRELVADEWRNLLEIGAVESRAELARRMGVSRARVSQVLRPV